MRINRFFYLLVLAIACVAGCGPAIRSFTAAPLTVNDPDSVQLHWKVRGDPVIQFHKNNTMMASDSMELWEFTLVVSKGKQEKKQMIQVSVVPALATDVIEFPTTLHGDTLIAAGSKNPLRWDDRWRLATVSSERPLQVLHEGKRILLPHSSVPSEALKGTPVGGAWEFRYLLTETEKADRGLLPESLKITATLTRQK